MSKINLLDHNFDLPKKRKLKLFIIYLLAFFGIIFFIFLYNILFSQEGFIHNFVYNLKTFSKIKDKPVEQQNRLNILLLGYGGPGHDGPNLTDSIQVISVNLKTNKIIMISIPRDLLVNIPDYGKWKVNHAFALPEQDSPGSGGIVASKVIGDVLGIKIDYYVAVDFNSFVKIINDFGGIDIYVPHTFVDSQYPTKDHKYQTIRFEKGWQTMDGETALKFARSRHGYCIGKCAFPEGSDFARAKRQQIVLMAMKDKLLSNKALTNPKNLYSLFNVYKKYIKTNIALWDINNFYSLLKKVDLNNIQHFVLDAGSKGLLQEGRFAGAYVLFPKAGMFNFSQIHLAVKNLFDPVDKIDNLQIINKDVVVEVLNGTNIQGFAAEVANRLDKYGIKVSKIGNADKRNVKQTIIYDFSNGENPELTQKIQRILANARIEVNIPQKIIDKYNKQYIIEVNNTPIPAENKTDFLIILGSDLYAVMGFDTKI